MDMGEVTAGLDNEAKKDGVGGSLSLNSTEAVSS